MLLVIFFLKLLIWQLTGGIVGFLVQYTGLLRNDVSYLGDSFLFM